ncbi:sigma-70 family RNA polymerase sigma factor [Salinifilum ghardaiensis]
MTTALATEFEQHRARLTGVAYRLLGTLADAEDAVQEAWLRLAGADHDRIDDLGAWLTTVVSRLCLDRMRSAAARREQYPGSWLPEPVVTDEQHPDAVVGERDDLRMAALRILHELSADQRLALVLHDGFDVPFGEIAALLGCSAAAARQHASRARRAMAEGDPAPRATLSEQRAVLERFLVAVNTGDVAEIARTLHPRAVVHGDGGGRARTARHPVRGADNVARFTAGLVAKYGADMIAGARPVLVNGDAGLLLPGSPEGSPVAPRVMTLSVREGRVDELFDVVNPDKLTRVPW